MAAPLNTEKKESKISNPMRMMKTNKIYIAAATLALGLAACSEQADFTQADVVNAAVENGDMPVQFDTYMGSARNNTRAYLGSYTGGAITNEGTGGTKKLKDVGFGVFAYHSGTATFGDGGWSTWNPGQNPLASVNKQPNFMYNEKVTWTAAKGWSYDNVKYWPNGIDNANAANTPSNTATEQAAQYLSFFAYAPYVDIQADYSDDKPTSPAVTNAKTTGVTGANTYGIVAMSRNDEATDMQLKYAFNTAANGASELNAVDLLWGLRGQMTYQETDASNNSVTELGSLYNTDLTKQIVTERVKFLFKHALARVGGSTNSTTSASGNQICGLKVVVDVDKNSDAAGEGQSAQLDYFSSDFSNTTTLVTIKEVKIRDKYSYEFETNPSTTAVSDFAAEGWFDIMQGEWTKSTAAASSPGITYSVVADNQQSSVDNATPYSLNQDIMEPKTAYSVRNSSISAGNWNISGTTGVTLTAKNVYADENVPGLLLIPGNNTNTLYVTVDYFVRTIDTKLSWDGDGSTDTRTDNQFTEVEQVITNKVELDGNLLDPNKFYTIVMHLGMTSVKFEAVVADWATSTDEYTESGGETTPGDETPTSVWLPSNVVAAASPSVAAGSSISLSTGADVTPLTVNITGFDASESLTATPGGATKATCTPGSAGTDGKATLSITMAPNKTNSPVVSTLTVTGGTSGKSTVITITQAADETFTVSTTEISKDGTTTPGTITVEKKSTAITGVTAGAVDGLTIGAFAADGDNFKSSSVTASNNTTTSPIEKEVTLTINTEYTYKVKIKQSGE